ncbi:TPR repeat protein-like protein [Lepidopterella palustris CBS 459.81]|uniref:TPR repeat protein-like protein n=1 Tax=Lepidopterella palustris CBS 459.81 TaxID=1314670 RepID=A0A8E2JE19_9PEZI|nr:TPR repeat protein-like protein [Lepidopterella palustris CBS 459.81]
MAEIRERSADEVLKEMNRVPLFMTNLDETDGEGGENVELEALKALAYEGTRSEVAGNFRQQGNELARQKKWSDAKEYYDKAIAALKAPRKSQDAEEGPADIEVVELDEEAERKKEREVEEACYVNRALCNLEKKNYRSCIHDCASTLRINPSNVKALYRSALACFALDKLPEASDACTRGLYIDPSNAALKALTSKVSSRKSHLDSIERERREREERKAAEERALKLALMSRNIPTRTSEQAPEMEDAAIKLEKPLDPLSTLSIPVILLYPLHMQSDFIKAFVETETLGEHLQYILPVPWDEAGEYTVEGVECYMETIAGGLIKAGKKLAMRKILGSGKVEVVDGLVRLNVLPKAKAQGWIEEFKKRRKT